MINRNATEPTKIWFLLDRSGSMGGLAQDVIGGFNSFVAEQSNEPGTSHLTLVQFDSQAPFQTIHDAVPIGDVPELTANVYRPRGTTPLLDAIGNLIESADQRIETRSRDNQPEEDQLVLIFSDGLENASHKYNWAMIAKLIKERQEAGWEFVFMGANQDAYLEAGRIGVRQESISNFEASAVGTEAAFRSMSRGTRQFREKTRYERRRDSGAFFGGIRESEEMMEEMRNRNGGQSRIPNLEMATVGQPITRLGISLFPIYLPGNYLPEIATGPNSGLVIEEQAASTVPSLQVTNPTNLPILIPEGEQLVGGLQDRVANTSILVAPASRLDIPVSCLEQGRWGDRRDFGRGRAFTPRRTRRAKNASVSDSVRRNRSRRSDQAAVWNTIDRELTHLGVSSDTRAVRDAEQSLRHDQQRRQTVRRMAQRGPLPNQCGVVVSHGWRVVAIELFGNHDLLVPHWEGIVRSHLMERLTATGEPSKTEARDRIRRFAQAAAVTNPGVGLGTEVHVNDGRTVGQALIYQDAVVYASAFMIG